MATHAHRPRGPRVFQGAPYFVLALSLLVTAGIAYYVGAATRHRNEIRFESAVWQTTEAIESRLETHVALLRAGVGLFAASPGVTRDDFRAFVDRLHLPTRYPGIQGIGLTKRVAPGARAALAERLRGEGVEWPGIWPDYERPEYHAIVYLEPLDRRNRAAIGYDMFSEPVRRAAMQLARDTGLPAASGRVTLVQEIDERKQPGFLVYLPVYERGTTPTTVAARRASLRGFVYSPFRADDLLAGIFGVGGNRLVDFAVYDGSEVTVERLLHRSEVAVPGAPTATVALTVAGRTWTLVLSPGVEFDRAGGGSPVPYVVLGGVAVSLLLFGVVRSQARAQAVAERVAADLQASEQALRQSESRLRRLVDANVIGIMIGDARGRIVEANDSFLGLVGYSRADVEAGAVNWIDLTPPEHRALDERAAEEMRATGRHAPFEKEYLRKHGGRVPVLVASAYLGGPDELRAGIVVDLAERKRAEEEREQLLRREQAARQDAEAANRLKDEFLATVSHELRTPLNAMLGWTTLLRTSEMDAAARARAVETIERNARAQARLVDDLLEVSSVVTGKLRLALGDVDLVHVIDTAIEAVRQAAEAKGLRLDATLDPAFRAASGDPDRLQQVVWNLLSNAIKFTDAGGRVHVALDGDERRTRITVTDTGRGIPPEFLPHVFERFRQSDSSITRAHRGLGLGLALVRHLVELHGGEVAAESPGPDKGATFTVVLPRGAAHAGPSAVPPVRPALAPGARGHTPTRLPGVRVLVVDDEPDARGLLDAVLRQCGAEVRAVGSAQEAVEAVRVFRPHVLVSDIGMPDEDGYALIRRVRAMEPSLGGRVPALALTAFAMPDDRRRALDAGYQMHVAKPVDPAALVAAVDALAAQGPGRPA